ncbi:MAG: methyltransferase [Burkholderiales bacterium]|nr:methyltransferase [Burkholderiales bacterium]
MTDSSMAAQPSGGPLAETPPRRRMLGWLEDQIGAWRNRWVGRASFRDWAGRFWLTRPMARREAARLFDLCAGFIYSQVLLAIVRLELIAFLSAGPATTSAIAAHAQLPEENAECLLAAAAALDLLHRRADGRWQLGALGAALQDNAALLALIRHHAVLYEDLTDPVSLMKGDGRDTRLAAFWRYAGQPATAAKAPPDVVRAYTELMAATQPLVTQQILGAVPLAGRRTLLDVGGGNGTFLAAVAKRHPHLELMLFDLPGVVALAARNLEDAGVADRVRLVGGSFHDDALPDGADTVSLVRVLHDHDDAAALALLTRIRASLSPGGWLILAEPMAAAPDAARMGHAYFGIYLHAMGSGRPRTVQENKDLLQKAGFRAIRVRPTAVPLQVQVLVAEAGTDPTRVEI